MSTLVRAEVLKLRTTRTFAALVAANVGLSLLIVVLSSILGDDFSEQDVRELFFSDFTSLFIMLLGVMGMAGEWRHRTITGTILAAPDRIRLLGAKVLSYALAGVVLSFAVTVTSMIAALAILSARGETTIGVTDLADALWRNLLVAALLGALGVLVGALIRNQVVAIVGLLIFTFALEPALIGLAPEVGRFGPTVGAPNGILGVEFFDEDPLPPGAALPVMLGWLGVGFALAAATLRQRDLV